jgi:hypothetical protein
VIPASGENTLPVLGPRSGPGAPAIAITPLPGPNPVTATGALLPVLVVSPFPNWPERLFPQANTEPSDLSAMLDEAPAAMAMIPEPLPNPFTAMGVALKVSVPSPNSPWSLAPQATFPDGERDGGPV